MADFKRRTLAEQILEGKADTGAKTSSNDALSERLDRDFAPAWRPSPGDKLVGRIVEMNVREQTMYDDYVVVTIRTDDDDEWAVHCLHSVLANEFKRANPQISDLVAVKYNGERQRQNGKGTFHHYRVIKEATDTGNVWDRVATDREEPF
jgi:hypothetical protein